MTEFPSVRCQNLFNQTAGDENYLKIIKFRGFPRNHPWPNADCILYIDIDHTHFYLYSSKRYQFSKIL